MTGQVTKKHPLTLLIVIFNVATDTKRPNKLRNLQYSKQDYSISNFIIIFFINSR